MAEVRMVQFLVPVFQPLCLVAFEGEIDLEYLRLQFCDGIGVDGLVTFQQVEETVGHHQFGAELEISGIKIKSNSNMSVEVISVDENMGDAAVFFLLGVGCQVEGVLGADQHIRSCIVDAVTLEFQAERELHEGGLNILAGHQQLLRLAILVAVYGVFQVSFAEGERRGEPQVEVIAHAQIADETDHKAKGGIGFHTVQIGRIGIQVWDGIDKLISGKVTGGVIIHPALESLLGMEGEEHLVYAQLEAEMVRDLVGIPEVQAFHTLPQNKGSRQ